MWDTGSDLGEFTGHSRGVNRSRPFSSVILLVSISDRAAPSASSLLPMTCWSPSTRVLRSNSTTPTRTTRTSSTPCGTPSPPFEGKVGSCTLTHSQTGEYLRTFSAANGHTKGLYGVGWDADSKHVYTVSADCTVKVRAFVYSNA